MAFTSRSSAPHESHGNPASPARRRPTLDELAETRVLSNETIAARTGSNRPTAAAAVETVGGDAPAAQRARRDRLLGATAGLAVVGQATRKRPALSVTLAAVGLGAVVASAVGLSPGRAEFRPPPAAGTQAPVTAEASAAAAYSGIAPYARTPPAAGDHLEPGTRPGRGKNGRSSPSSPANGSTPADPLASIVPPAPDQPGAGVRESTGPARARAPETASISIGRPNDGDTLTAGTTVSGEAGLPAEHQIWLLWRHGTGSYHVAGACRGGRSFTCDTPALERGGDEIFQLTVVVVDADTGRGLRAGETRDALPGHLARHDVTVRRPADQ
ncbi:hypothetical protein [Actinoplanes sp. NPDC049802]|uniref:hypothetical protein n=1 Tax=Actinoplanes sp. NPDC049802 TaxID=3154742 RepID=UPI003400782D